MIRYLAIGEVLASRAAACLRGMLGKRRDEKGSKMKERKRIDRKREREN